MSTVYLNGEYIANERALIPAEDRGFIFGDGIYEGVRAVEGRLFEWSSHAERMVNGLAGLRITFGADRVAELKSVCERLVMENGLGDDEVFLYLQVSRGAAPRTHHFPPAGTPPTVFVTASRLVIPRDLRERGASAITYPDLRWARCDWKTVNLLGTVLARQAAAEVGAYEAILVRDGIVTEGAATNVFAVMGGMLRTHPLTHHILPGITRKVLLQLARENGVTVVEEPIPEGELAHVGELFVCGTTTDVTPVVTLDGKRIGSGTPGRVTRKLQEALTTRMYSAVAAGR